MKTTALRRLAGLAGLLVLSLLLVAVFVPVAPAMNVDGSGAGGGVTVATLGTAQPGTAAGGVSLPAGVAAARAPAATSGTSSTTPWIVTGIIAAAVVVTIAAWATTRSRARSVRPSAEYCSLHPDDALCGAI
jgi:hypothetical protein